MQNAVHNGKFVLGAMIALYHYQYEIHQSSERGPGKQICEVEQSKYCKEAECSDFREQFYGLPEFKNLSVNQKVMLDDFITSGESLDVMRSFILRPPELLFVDSVEHYFSWFCIGEKENLNELTLLFSSPATTTLIACTGHQVHLKEDELENFVAFMESGDWNAGFADAVNFCREFSHAVFTVVSPRRKTDFLNSFVLRLGRFTSERDLFATHDFKESYIVAKFLARQQIYDRGEVMQVVKLYVQSDSMHLPGGSQSFGNKVRGAKSALSSRFRVADD